MNSKIGTILLRVFSGCFMMILGLFVLVMGIGIMGLVCH